MDNVIGVEGYIDGSLLSLDSVRTAIMTSIDSSLIIAKITSAGTSKIPIPLDI